MEMESVLTTDLLVCVFNVVVPVSHVVMRAEFHLDVISLIKGISVLRVPVRRQTYNFGKTYVV